MALLLVIPVLTFPFQLCLHSATCWQMPHYISKLEEMVLPSEAPLWDIGLAQSSKDFPKTRGKGRMSQVREGTKGAKGGATGGKARLLPSPYPILKPSTR